MDFFSFLNFGSTEHCIQGLFHGKQALCHWVLQPQPLGAVIIF